MEELLLRLYFYALENAKVLVGLLGPSKQIHLGSSFHFQKHAAGFQVMVQLIDFRINQIPRGSKAKPLSLKLRVRSRQK